MGEAKIGARPSSASRGEIRHERPRARPFGKCELTPQHEGVAHVISVCAARFSREIHYKMMPVMRALFIETNLSPVKPMLAFMGRCANELRMPLCRGPRRPPTTSAPR